MNPALRKKRVWTVADFAMHAYGRAETADCLRARRFLKRLDAKHKGRLLLERGGENCALTFMPATLARLEPDLFESIESLEMRVDALEDDVAELRLDQGRMRSIVVPQVGANTRDIQKLKTRKVA